MPKLAVIWRAAGLLMAIDADSVIEVLPPVACQPAPGVPSWVRGLFVHRGRLAPLVDASKLLGAPAQPDRMVNRVLALRVMGDGARPDWPVGLWVESVLELEPIDFDSPGGHPGFSTEAGRFLGPVTKTRVGLVQLVKPAELFTPEQIEVLTRRLAGEAA